MSGHVNFAADQYIAQAVTQFAADIAAATDADRPARLAEAVATLAYINAPRLRDDQITAALKDAPNVGGREVQWAATLRLRPASQTQFAVENRPCDLKPGGLFRAGRCAPIADCLCAKAGWI